jgi:hypothetical protein
MEYVMASIIVEKNKDKDFALMIQQKLTEADIYNVGIGYNETKRKSGLPTKHFSMNAGLTVQQARLKKEEMLKTSIDDKDFDKTIDSLNKKNNTNWSYKVETVYVESSDESEPEMKEFKYEGETYSYYLNKDKNNYIFYDKYGLVVEKKKIKTLTEQVTKAKKPLKIKIDNGEDDTNNRGQKTMSFTFSSLKNAKKIDWDLKQAFKDNFEKLNNQDSIRVVLEIDDKIMIKNKIIKDYKSEFIGTFGEVDMMYMKIKKHIKELKQI